MREGGELRVSTRMNDGWLDLEISDNGSGMTKGQMKNLFEPFYTSKSRGLGLGMSFVAKVVGQHGGTVAVTSRLGEGTRIRINLPVEGEKSDEANWQNPRSG
jgi:two-component system sensor histidine kinase HydH